MRAIAAISRAARRLRVRWRSLLLLRYLLITPMVTRLSVARKVLKPMERAPRKCRFVACRAALNSNELMCSPRPFSGLIFDSRHCHLKANRHFHKAEFSECRPVEFGLVNAPVSSRTSEPRVEELEI